MEDIINDALNGIAGFFNDLFAAVLRDRLDSMFTFIDDAASIISGEVAKSPSDWNNTIFTLLQKIAENVMLPIGTMIITALLCYEIFTMVVNQNHISKDGGETSFFFIIIMKAVIAVYMLSHCWEITLAIFDVGTHIVTAVTAGYMSPASESLGIFGLNAFNDEIDAMNIGQLMGACFEATLVNTAMTVISLIIECVLFGRMMEIYMYISVAPIPFSTLINKEWGMIGTNYIRTLCALAFQTFFIIICVVVFNDLVGNIVVTSLSQGLWSVLLYAFLLGVMLFKSGTISRSIFNAH